MKFRFSIHSLWQHQVPTQNSPEAFPHPRLLCFLLPSYSLALMTPTMWLSLCPLILQFLSHLGLKTTPCLPVPVRCPQALRGPLTTWPLSTSTSHLPAAHSQELSAFSLLLECATQAPLGISKPSLWTRRLLPTCQAPAQCPSSDTALTLEMT